MLSIADKIKTSEEMQQVRRKMSHAGKKLVFTNGCFDILHRGHVEYLQEAAALGDALMIGLNSDASVRRLKGAARPVVSEEDRAWLLAALMMVDFVTVFDSDTPLELIKTVLPDILVKGGDYTRDSIVGAREVEQAGGKVRVIAFVAGKSTTGILERIQKGMI